MESYSCSKCGRVFLNYRSLNAHMRVHAGNAGFKRKGGDVWNKGISAKDCPNLRLSEERKKAVSTRMFKHNPMHRLGVNKSNLGGYRHGSGRGIKGRYKGYWCDSSWELAWVVYQLDRGVKFERNKDRFPYVLDGVVHRYLPDFKLSDGTYVEIKGWEWSNLSLKVASVVGELLLIGPQEMKPILSYVEDKYGHDFVKLYERRVA